MRIRVRFFASLRELVQRDEADLDLPAGATPERVWAELAGRYAELAPRRASLMVAVNRRYAGFDTELADGDELVFVPPVSGGSGIGAEARDLLAHHSRP